MKYMNARMVARRICCMLALSGLATLAQHTPVAAQPRIIAAPRVLQQAEIQALLEKIQQAATQLDYTGVYTWQQQGDTLQSSRIVHIVDATGERERIARLDGAAREFIRHNEVVQCLVPEKKLVLVEHRRHPRFPGLQFAQAFAQTHDNPNRFTRELAQHYTFSRTRLRQRVAGRTCTQIDIQPKDSLRYGQRLCVDNRSGLLLKHQTLNQHGHVMEQIAFTSLQLGQNVWQEQLTPSWETHGWTRQEIEQEQIDATKLGWHVPLPAGFRYVAQTRRPMPNGPPVMHLLLADGLSAISVFIEPRHGSLKRQPEPSRSAGAVGMHGVRVGAYWLTTVGEVPLPTLKTLAEKVRHVAPK